MKRMTQNGWPTDEARQRAATAMRALAEAVERGIRSDGLRLRTAELTVENDVKERYDDTYVVPELYYDTGRTVITLEWERPR